MTLLSESAIVLVQHVERPASLERLLPTAVAATAAAIGLLAVARSRFRDSDGCGQQAFVASPLLNAIRPMPRAGPAGLTVASLNILLKAFASKSYSSYVPAHLKDWNSHRLPLLQATLENLNADLVALQEASVLSFEHDMSDFLSRQGYHLIAPYDKDAVKKNADMDKTAILYRPSVFTHVWTQHRSRAVAACFTHLETQQTVYVVSCHLEGHPSKAKERFQQMKSVLGSIEAHWKSGGQTTPHGKKQKQRPGAHVEAEEVVRTARPAEPFVIVAGDFNSHEDHAVYKLLSDGCLDASFRDPWGSEGGVVAEQSYTSPFPLTDVYKAVRAGSQFGTYLANGRKPACIDFIFASSRFGVEYVRPPYTDNQLQDALRTGVPNEWCVSDHFPLAAYLTLPPTVR